METQPMPTPAKKQGHLLLLSFLLPMAAFLFTCILHRVYPFGTNQILIIDLLQQYHPFLQALQERIRGGSSLLWSWNGGLGINFAALFAYYLASPLNLLITLAPQAYLPEAITLSIALRIGLSGLGFAVFLLNAYRRCDAAIVLFSVCYALCGFAVGYYWNIIWLDGFCVLPIVCLGTLRLLEGRHAAPYVLSLAYAVWCNFIIGFYICLFVALLFLCDAIATWAGPARFFRKLLRMLAFSAMALGLTAVLLLPAALRIPHLARPASAPPSPVALYASFIDVLGNFAPLYAPTVRTGLPNVYSGLLPVLLLGPFCLDAAIPRKRRVLSLCALAFLLLSVNVNVLDYAWNGLTLPIQIPFRFVFLLSFVLCVMGYRAFPRLCMPKGKDLLLMLLTGGALAVCACLGPQPRRAAVACLIFTCAYVLSLFLKGRACLPRPAAQAALLALVILETGMTFPLGMEAAGLTARGTLLESPGETRALLASATGRTGAFSRIEVSPDIMDNNPMLYGYPGMSLFASTANGHVTRFLEGLGGGAFAVNNRLSYGETSPFMDMLLAMRYYVSRGENPVSGPQWTIIESNGDAALYENRYALPLGFMAPASILEHTGNVINPFLAQNDLFARMTGLTAPLFADALPVSHVGHTGVNASPAQHGMYAYTIPAGQRAPTLRWYFEIPQDGTYYCYVRTSGSATLTIQSAEAQTVRDINVPSIIPVGNCQAGERISLLAAPFPGDPGGMAVAFVCRLDPDALEAGHARLARQPLDARTHGDTRLEASISADEDGLLYTSIPYEAGWRVWVDGGEVEPVTLGGAMLCVPLEAGEHTLSFRYRPQGLLPGLFISALSAAALAAYCAAYVHKRKRSGPPPLP